MDRVITLAYNPTSWNRREAAPWPGGMVDAVVQPILPHLPPGSWRITNMPDATQPSVMFAFPHRYRLPAKKIYGTPSIFISHGVADKGWREPAKLIRWGFDYTLVSGPMWVRRFTRGGMHPWRVKEIGWPKLDPIVNGDIPRQPRGDKIRVLWAPTHGGGAEPRHGDDGPIRRGTSRRTSWHHRDMIEQLLPPSEFELIVAPHPRHRKGKAATLAEYTRADVVVADGGSTIYEAWALDLPVVLPTWITRSGNMNSGAVERRIYKGGIGRHARCADDLPRLVVDAAEKGITLVEQEFIEPIIPRTTRGVAGKLAAEALMECADHPIHTRTRDRVLRGRR